MGKAKKYNMRDSAQSSAAALSAIFLLLLSIPVVIILGLCGVFDSEEQGDGILYVGGDAILLVDEDKPEYKPKKDCDCVGVATSEPDCGEDYKAEWSIDGWNCVHFSLHNGDKWDNYWYYCCDCEC